MYAEYWRYWLGDLGRMAQRHAATVAAGPDDEFRDFVSRFQPALCGVSEVDRLVPQVVRLQEALRSGRWDAAAVDCVVGLLEAAVDLAPTPSERLESIEELSANGVPDPQICLIYGFVDERGQPEAWKLQEERFQPGRWTGQGWEPPLVRRHRQWVAQQREAIAALAESLRSKLPRAPEAPEPLDRLLGDGVPASQVAAMTGHSVEEVLAEAGQLGIAVETRARVPVDARAPQEPELDRWAQAAAVLRRKGLLDDQVRLDDWRQLELFGDLFGQGQSLRQIAEALQVSWRQVRRLKDRWEALHGGGQEARGEAGGVAQ